MLDDNSELDCVKSLFIHPLLELDLLHFSYS